jgi:hypothetical protein
MAESLFQVQRSPVSMIEPSRAFRDGVAECIRRGISRSPQPPEQVQRKRSPARFPIPGQFASTSPENVPRNPIQFPKPVTFRIIPSQTVPPAEKLPHPILTKPKILSNQNVRGLAPGNGSTTTNGE